MSTPLTIPVRISGVQDTVQGSPIVESVEEDYKASYAFKTCTFLQQAYPEQFKQFFPGGFEECVNTMGAAADVYFDKWKTNYPIGLVARARATLATAGVK